MLHIGVRSIGSPAVRPTTSRPRWRQSRAPRALRGGTGMLVAGALAALASGCDATEQSDDQDERPPAGSAAAWVWDSGKPMAAGRPQWPAAVVDTEGTATVAWVGGAGVLARQQRLGKPWGRVEHVSDPWWARFTALGVDRNGHVTAVWEEEPRQGPAYQIMSARRLDNGEWTEPRRLAETHDPEAELDNLLLVESPTGEAVVVWEEDVGPIRVVSRSSRGSWSAPRRLAWGELPVATISSRGVATVAFTTFGPPGLVLFRHDSQGWTRAPRLLGARRPMGVAMDSRTGETAVVAWQDPRSGRYMTARYDGRWSGVRQISEPLGPTLDSHVVAGRDGSAVFTWTMGKGVHCGDLRSVYQPAAGQPAGPPQTIASGASGSCAAPVSLAVGPQGEAVLAWFASDRKGREVRVTSRGPGDEEWADSEAIARDDHFAALQMPAAAIARDGSALVAWAVRNPDWRLWTSRGTSIP